MDSETLILQSINKKNEQLLNEINILKKNVYNLSVVIQVQTLHRHFLEYKNAFTNREVVLVATGPTASYYEPIKNAIHIGVNRAIYLNKINFDFIFCQDYFKFFKGRENLVEDICAYRPFSCKKFFGVHPQEMAKIEFSRKTLIDRIPLWQLTNAPNCQQYMLEEYAFHNWAYDLSVEPIGNFVGTIFSALQFVLYTNPKAIYLVGCDCSEGQANSSEKIGAPPIQLSVWKDKVKPYLLRYYPTLKVTSINPVNLKNVFNDLFTENYIESQNQ